MRAFIVVAVFAAAAVATAAAAGVKEIPAPPLTTKDIESLKSPNAIFIWDGHADLILHVSVLDSATQRPIGAASVSAVRDRRVARHLGRSYKLIPAGVTDVNGHAILRGEFPAAGDASGSCVFVLDSYVIAEAVGHVAQRARVSPIYRLDFQRGKKRYDVAVRIILKAK
jgi:hypothetical protein